MYAKNVTASALQELAEQLGFEADTENQPERHRVKFRLKNNSDRYWVVSPGISSSDRVMKRGVCYHGHYHFLERLFLQYPDAIVEANWYKRVKYDSDNFVDLAEEVGDTVIRPFDGLCVRDRCACGEST